MQVAVLPALTSAELTHVWFEGVRLRAMQREGCRDGDDNEQERFGTSQRVHIIDLLMGLFRGAVFHHGRDARKQPIKQPTEMPTSTMALMGRFPSLMGRFPDLNGAFHRFHTKGPFYLLKIHWKTAH